MKKKDWILLALNCSEDKTLSPLQLQKSLFLLSQMYPDEFSNNFYNFVPYHYGPFCLQIYEDVDFLKSKDLISIKVDTIRRWKTYSITDKGLNYIDNLRKKIEPEVYNYLSKIIKWIKSQSFSQLMSSIYKQFPKFKVNSVFKDSL